MRSAKAKHTHTNTHAQTSESVWFCFPLLLNVSPSSLFQSPSQETIYWFCCVHWVVACYTHFSLLVYLLHNLHTSQHIYQPTDPLSSTSSSFSSLFFFFGSLPIYLTATPLNSLVLIYRSQLVTWIPVSFYGRLPSNPADF